MTTPKLSKSLSIYAGIFIGIGTMVYMAQPGLTGAVLFAIGLMAVVKHKCLLFTGKVGYYYDTKSYTYYAKMLMLNALGIIATVFALYSGLHSTGMMLTAETIVNTRILNANTVLLPAIGCGMLMSFAVSGFRKPETASQGIVPYLNILFAVPVFILCGFPHCVADLGYYTVFMMTHTFSWKVLILLIVIWCNTVLGNIFGCRIMGDFLEDSKAKNS